MPVSTTPSVAAPQSRTAERNSTSADGRQEFSGAASVSRIRGLASMPASSIWRPPGARSTESFPTGRPSEASRTCRPQMTESRSANRPVNAAGMCCTIRIGTRTWGTNAGNTSASAAGPPVETAITTPATAVRLPGWTGRGSAPAGVACGPAARPVTPRLTTCLIRVSTSPRIRAATSSGLRPAGLAT